VHVSEGSGGKKEVSVRTPVGSLEINKSVNEASLGLPIYPGATRVQDNDHEGSVNMAFGGDKGVRLVVAKFETPDSIEEVRDFYQDRIGSQVTKFREKDDEGKTVFEIKHKDSERVVALKSVRGGTQIDLVRVEHGGGEAN